MNTAQRRRRKREDRASDARRAVVDIGSNTVRLVVYEGPSRAPKTIWNEKVAARLGRDLSSTNRIPEEAEEEALGALGRYALLLGDLGVEDVETVATAAPREAENGAEFLGKVSRLGLAPRLLSGEEEACAAAMGVIGAFPGAQGLVADLGGGSLELIAISQGECGTGESLPLGTLRLPALRKGKDFVQRLAATFQGIEWAQDLSGPMYMVGGTWRAFARYAMDVAQYPLTDPHGFELDPDHARELCLKLMEASPEVLTTIPGVKPMRADYLPDAAAMLCVMLDTFAPQRLVFSYWGLREGLLFQRLDPLQRGKDPLQAAVDAFAGSRRSPITDAARVAGWTTGLADGTHPDNPRLRLAAAQLAAALQRVEPNLRVSHATEWALDKRWIGCDPRGRAMICAALFGSLGRTALPESFRKLAGDDDLRDGVAWGLAIRLARRMGSSQVLQTTSTLERDDAHLVLRIDESRAAIAHYPLTQDVDVLANWLGLEPRIEIGGVGQAG